MRTLLFDPRRVPVFYGWIVLAVGTAGMLMSAPGQTVGVSVFTDYLISALDITRSQLSLAYLLGTIGSAVSLALTGRLYDRYGARRVAAAASLGMGLVLLLLTLLPRVSALGAVMMFLLLSLGFWGLRFTGQGMLTLASRNMVMEWFERRRGRANAVMGVSISFGFSVAPQIFEAAIGADGNWRGAWRMAAAAAAAFALVALLVYRDRPEDHGMEPDGPMRGPLPERRGESAPGRGFTLPEARRTYSFWVFAIGLLLSGLLLTAYTFNIVSIFGDAGMSRAAAVAVFLPAAVVAVVVQFAGSWISDYVRLKYLLIAQMLGALILSLALVGLGGDTGLSSGLLVAAVVAGHGLMQGVFGILSNVTWPQFYGRAHLGAIAGLANAITVAGTAIGPILFSAVRDLRGNYSAAAMMTAVLAAGVGLAAIRADRPA